MKYKGQINKQIIFICSLSIVLNLAAINAHAIEDNPDLHIDIKDTNWGIKFIPRLARNISILEAKWTFGDGSSSIRLEPIHWYQNPGEYTVTLVILTGIGTNLRADRVVIVDERSNVDLIFKIIQIDSDRISFNLGKYELIFTELSLALSGMVALVAVAVSVHDKNRYGSRYRESTAAAILRLLAVVWVVFAFGMVLWLESGGG